jgi:hypothetical protein
VGSAALRCRFDSFGFHSRRSSVLSVSHVFLDYKRLSRAFYGVVADIPSPYSYNERFGVRNWRFELIDFTILLLSVTITVFSPLLSSSILVGRVNDSLTSAELCKDARRFDRALQSRPWYLNFLNRYYWEELASPTWEIEKSRSRTEEYPGNRASDALVLCDLLGKYTRIEFPSRQACLWADMSGNDSDAVDTLISNLRYRILLRGHPKLRLIIREGWFWALVAGWATAIVAIIHAGGKNGRRDIGGFFFGSSVIFFLGVLNLVLLYKLKSALPDISLLIPLSIVFTVYLLVFRYLDKRFRVRHLLASLLSALGTLTWFILMRPGLPRPGLPDPVFDYSKQISWRWQAIEQTSIILGVLSILALIISVFKYDFFVAERAQPPQN